MKEERKEDQIKKDETNGLGLYSKYFSWARCPICNVVWNSSNVAFSFWYDEWPYVNLPVPAELPVKLCPEHVEEIVVEYVDGRKKGIKRTLYVDQVNEMKKTGLYCPVCRGKGLRWLDGCNDPGPGLQQGVWKCNQCHALIFLALRFTAGDEDEVGELVSVSYREDLQTKKELNEARNTICRIIKSKEARSKILCE